jgi:hypothetical protein
VLVTLVKRPFVAKKCVVVTFVKFAEPPFSVVLLSVAIVPEEEINVVIFPVVAIKFVNVPVVAMTEPADTKFEKKLVEVAFVKIASVDVTVPRTAFQRSALDPSERDASRDGIKFVEIFPRTARFVLVVFVPVALTQVRFVRPREPTARFVNEAFVEKRFVEVTDVPVALVNVRPFNEEMPETEREPREPVVAVTDVALTAPIARFVPVALRKVTSCNVD